MSIQKVRSIFLSDFHMGYKGFDAVALLNFLQSHQCQNLYLVGDIFDGWKLEERWYWNSTYTAIIDDIVHKQKQGTKIFYILGNHDEKLYDFLPFISRPLLNLSLGVKIDDHFVHKTLDGKRFLIIHGHQWDSRIVRNTSRPSHSIHQKYRRLKDWLVDHHILPPEKETTIEAGVKKRFSLGKAIATNGVALLNRFTQAAAYRAIEGHYDGIIYGHSHVPLLETQNSVLIANCGSWTLNETRAPKGHTAIIEDPDGKIGLTYWPSRRFEQTKANQKNIQPDAIKGNHNETRQIIKWVFNLWRPSRPYL